VLGWLVEVWKAYAHRAGTYQTRVLLTLVYFVVLGPATLIARLFGAHLLDLSAGTKTTWLERPKSDISLVALRRQF
jgi:hypothetical protein